MKNSIREKNRLERLAKLWPLTYGETFRKYRNKLSTILRNAKNQYYKEKLKLNQGNPKFHWNTINSLLGGTSKACNNQQIDLQPTCDDIPKLFNEHFIKMGSNNTSDDIRDDVNFIHYLPDPPSFSFI